MSYPVVVHADADGEIEEAAVWYEGRRMVLRLEFFAAVDRAIADIVENRRRSPVDTALERAVLQRFPNVGFLRARPAFRSGRLPSVRGAWRARRR